MMLHMAVKQAWTGLISNEIYRHFLKATDHHHIFSHTGSWSSRDAGNLKGMAVQVNGMGVICGVAHMKSVSPAQR